MNTYIDNLRHAYYELTGIAPAIDGETFGADSESGYARRLGMIKTECAVEARRKAWDGFWRWLGRAVPQLAKDQGRDLGAPMSLVTAAWDAAVPPDADAENQNVERAVRGGYMSQETAIRRVNPDAGSPEVEQEMVRIATEKSTARAQQMQDFAALPAAAGQQDGSDE